MEETCVEFQRKLEQERKSVFLYSEGIDTLVRRRMRSATATAGYYVTPYTLSQQDSWHISLLFICAYIEMKKILADSEEQSAKYDQLKLENETNSALIEV